MPIDSGAPTMLLFLLLSLIPRVHSSCEAANSEPELRWDDSHLGEEFVSDSVVLSNSTILLVAEYRLAANLSAGDVEHTVTPSCRNSNGRYQSKVVSSYRKNWVRVGADRERLEVWLPFNAGSFEDEAARPKCKFMLDIFVLAYTESCPDYGQWVVKTSLAVPDSPDKLNVARCETSYTLRSHFVQAFRFEAVVSDPSLRQGAAEIRWRPSLGYQKGCRTGALSYRISYAPALPASSGGEAGSWNEEFQVFERTLEDTSAQLDNPAAVKLNVSALSAFWLNDTQGELHAMLTGLSQDTLYGVEVAEYVNGSRATTGDAAAPLGFPLLLPRAGLFFPASFLGDVIRRLL